MSAQAWTQKNLFWWCGQGQMDTTSSIFILFAHPFHLSEVKEYSFVCFWVLVVLVMEPSTVCMLSMKSTSELQPHPEGRWRVEMGCSVYWDPSYSLRLDFQYGMGGGWSH
jgi:hypothetical protein